MADGVPRVDELFSRAVVAQLAEQRAQRETFTELERKVERLEALISTRFSDVSRLLRSGEVEMRLEVLEEEISTRFARIEKALSAGAGPGNLESLVERLERVEDALRGDDAAHRLVALERSMAERFGHLEESFRGDDHGVRLEALEHEVSARIDQLEETIRAAGLTQLEHAGGGGATTSELAARLEALEGSLGERFGHLEETVRAEDIGRRLKALELALDERSGRLEELARTGEVERRLEELTASVEQRSGRLEELAQSSDLEGRLEDLARGVDERLGEMRTALESVPRPDAKVEALDQAVGYRLTRLEGTLRRMEEHTAARLEKLAEASAAAEVGILERIIAESQVVAQHFEAVRPAIEAAASAAPELETTLVELRRLARNVGTGGNGENTGSHPVLDMSDQENANGAVDELFLPPEETPIPERRFGGLIPRRDR